MKHCKKCNIDVNTEGHVCPICNDVLVEKKEDNVVSFSDDVFPEKNEMHTVKMPDMVSENTVSEKPQGLDKIDFEKQLEESLKDL